MSIQVKTEIFKYIYDYQGANENGTKKIKSLGCLRFRYERIFILGLTTMNTKVNKVS